LIRYFLSLGGSGPASIAALMSDIIDASYACVCRDVPCSLLLKARTLCFIRLIAFSKLVMPLIECDDTNAEAGPSTPWHSTIMRRRTFMDPEFAPKEKQTQMLIQSNLDSWLLVEYSVRAQ
jgi:hypothetical protein